MDAGSSSWSGQDGRTEGGSEVRAWPAAAGGDPLSCGAGGSYAEGRDALYRRLFGEPADVLEDDDGALPTRVHVFPPGHAERHFYTLVTDGMSDRPMRVPADPGPRYRRAEMILYVDVPSRSTIALLRTLSKLPHRHGAWLGHGHTLPNGEPPAPFFPDSELDTMLVLETIVAPERDAWRFVALDEDPLRFLWPVPISSAECRLKLERGTAALLERFDEGRLSFVLDPQRPSLA